MEEQYREELATTVRNFTRDAFRNFNFLRYLPFLLVVTVATVTHVFLVFLAFLRCTFTVGLAAFAPTNVPVTLNR